MALRIQFLRIIALLIGLAVLLLHVMTLKPPGTAPGWLDVSLRDIFYHFTALGAFALAYRLSFAREAVSAGIITVLVCSGWGGLCELLQHWIPARDFSVIEFGVNTLTPVLIVGLLRMVILR